MTRVVYALLLGILTTFLICHSDLPTVTGQEKKKDKKGAVVEPLAGDIEDDLTRELPVFEPGSHTKPISAMGFSKDKARLITVGQDFTIQVWDTTTGRRLDMLRLPGYGREKGYDPGRWDIAAVSADGNRVAIGGQRKYFRDQQGNDSAPCRLLLVDLPKRRVMQVDVPLTPTGSGFVTALAFSPDGEQLAVGLERMKKENQNVFVIGGLTDRIAGSKTGINTAGCHPVRTPHVRGLSSLAFSPDGKQLLAGGEDRRVTVWDVPAGSTPMPTLAKEIAVDGATQSLAFSPDGKQFARTAHETQIGGLRNVEVWNGDGTRTNIWKADELKVLFTARPGKLFTVKYLDATTIYIVANGPADKGDGGASIAGTIEIATGKQKRVLVDADGMLRTTLGAVATDGGLVAVTINGNTEVIIGSSAGGMRVRCGVQNQIPHHVGWAKDPAKPGFAWTDERHSTKTLPTSDVLLFGFDLATVEPVGAIKGTDYVPSSRKLGDWTLEFGGKKVENEEVGKGLAQLKQSGKFVHGFPGAKGIGHTLVPNGDKPPLVACANHIDHQGDIGELYNADGPRITPLLPLTTRIHDMAASPDGRYLICTTGTPRVVVYRTDGSPYPIFSFAQLNGEWVIWTPEGYYAASPGGEKLFGWAVNNGPNDLVSFYPAEKFAKQYRRPDVIKLAIELGSVKAALKQLDAVPASIETFLPPRTELKLLKQAGLTVKVRGVVGSTVAGKPVVAMRVLLDGVPLSGGRGVAEVGPGKPTEAEWEFDVPPGTHELRLMARSEVGPSYSDPIIFKTPIPKDQKPIMHCVCVGVNDYDSPGLKLNAAAKDATDVFDALQANCAGEDNRFGVVKGVRLVDKAATREAVLAALTAVRKDARPGDLVIFFFAGHGVKQGGDYFLLTREANTDKDLKTTSISGTDLRDTLTGVECPVLMLLDACHSTSAVRSFRPATDDLTRSLTDEIVRVTVMSAAMSHETANAAGGNGYFTAALLKGLKTGPGVPFDPYEKQLYVHHLYSVVFSEVRNATNGKQNPFLNMPWANPPLAIRNVFTK